MTYTALSPEEQLANPLDVVEQLAIAQDWPFERRSDEEMAVEVAGHWCDYNLYFAWREDIGAMHLTCVFDLRVPDGRLAPVHELLALANEKLWLGHFGLWSEENVPLFRHSTLVRSPMGMAVEEVEDLIDIGIGECERFFPAFQFVIWGGRSAQDGLTAAMLETVGEA